MATEQKPGHGICTLAPDGKAEAIPEPRFGTASPRKVMSWCWFVLPFGYLWFRLIDNLRLEWTTNPQYAFGWVVPVLCVGLILRKWQGLPGVTGERSEVRSQKSVVVLFVLLAFLYLPTRLIEAATPEWRLIQWLLGMEAIGLTLCAIWLGKGHGWLRELAFPIAFFFVAIPWPTQFEAPIIQGLTRASAAVVVELLGWIGVPAVPHGNVIEVATGIVGIDEACSGIRSFQSSLMISLFLGEFYSLSRIRRWLLVPVAFGISMALNVLRMFMLTLIAAKKGVATIAQYHDPAGMSIAIVCTLALWGLAAWMRRKPGVSGQGSVVRSQKLEVGGELSTVGRSSALPSLFRLSMALLVWLVVVEAGVQVWYQHLEAHLKPGPAWSLNFPEDNTTLKDLPIPENARYLLRYDEGRQAVWTESGGLHWQVFYCNWLPGRVAGYLAKRHTPEICLRGAGLKMLSGPTLTMINVKGVELPVRCYVFETAAGPIQVFQCRWEAGAPASASVRYETERFNLIRGIWAGRGNKGQKVVEIIITGLNDPVVARAAMVRQLEKMITVNPGDVSKSGSAR